MPRRPWLAAEDLLVWAAHLDGLAPQAIGRALAGELGRTPAAVSQHASVLGVPPVYPHWPPRVLAAVARLNRRGLPDRRIAGRLGMTPDQAKALRARLGLPLVPDRDAKRRSIEGQRRTLGVRTAGELRAWAHRRFARECGWPEDLRPREVQVLNVLSARGVPLARKEIAAAIGMRTDYASHNAIRFVLRGNGPGGTYTATLARRGLVTILPHLGPPVGGTGKGAARRVSLYTLGPAALAILEARATCPATESATASPTAGPACAWPTPAKPLRPRTRSGPSSNRS